MRSRRFSFTFPWASVLGVIKYRECGYVVFDCQLTEIKSGDLSLRNQILDEGLAHEEQGHEPIGGSDELKLAKK